MVPFRLCQTITTYLFFVAERLTVVIFDFMQMLCNGYLPSSNLQTISSVAWCWG